MTPTRDVNELVSVLYQLGGGVNVQKRLGQFSVIAHPAAAGVLLQNPNVFIKDYGRLQLMGTSRIFANGAPWKARRSLTQPHYNVAGAPANRQTIVTTFEQGLDTLDQATGEGRGPAARDLAAATLRCTTRVYLDALGLEDDVAPILATLAEQRRLGFQFQNASLCNQASVDLEGTVARFDALRNRVRQYALGHPRAAQLLARFQQDYEGGDAFSAIDELLANIFAGIETSAGALAWAMSMAGRHPDVQEEMRAEARTEGERPVLAAFIHEVLRAFPPIPLVTRRATRDFQSAELTAEAGQHFLLSIVGVHQDPDQWDQPARFDPKRPEFRDRTYNRRAFLPFLMGPRVCGGAALARMEIGEGFAAVLRRYRFTGTGGSLRFQLALALRPVLGETLSVERLA